MAYQALYRKFRPDEFEEVKGQEHIVKTIKNQIKADRIGHAYLFCGTRGTGKTTVAKLFAKAVNCEHPVDGSPCNQCPTCKSIQAQTSMDVIEMDAASNNGVEDIRAIRDNVQYSPTEGKYKVYIIDEVHMLSPGAFNALLKTLEEPPAYVIFILATTEAHKIPITILSRCQRYDFKRISIDTIADRLKDLMVRENIDVEDKAIRYVAKAADGSMRDALSLLDQCIAFYLGEKLTYESVLEVLGAVDMDVLSDLYNTIVSRNVEQMLNQVEQLVMSGREMTQFVNDFTWFLRNLLLVKESPDLKDVLEVSEEQLELLIKDAALMESDQLMRFIRICSDLSNRLRYSTQKRIDVELAFVKLCKPQMEQDLSSLIQRVQQLEAQVEQLESEGPRQVTVTAPTQSVTEEGMSQDDLRAELLKRLEPAQLEDLKAVLANLPKVMEELETQNVGMTLRFFKESKFNIEPDGTTLRIVVPYGKSSFFNKEETTNRISEAFAKVCEKEVKFRIVEMPKTQTKEFGFMDLQALIHMDITVE